MDGAYVLADDAQEEQLHGGEEEQPYHQRRDAHGDLVPVEQLVDKVGETDEQVTTEPKKPIMVASRRGTLEWLVTPSIARS